MSEDCVAHGALVDQPEVRTVQTSGRVGCSPSPPVPHQPALPPWPGPSLPRASLGLLSLEAGMLGVEVGMGTWPRLEGHGADGALVENLAVRRLDVGLDGVHTPKHH